MAVSVPSRLWFPLWLCCCFASRSCQAPVKITNHRPIIGVLSQETVGDLRELGRTYIAASYVKFVEAGGARVVPIRVNLTESEYTDLFNSLNGVVFPGGDVDIEESAYAKASKLLFDLALQANERGDYFPVWGVCLGLEELSFLTSGENLLTLTHTKDIALPLNFTRESRQSKLFQNFPKHILDTLASEPITSNLHSWSLSLKNFSANDKLRKFYRVLTTNTDSSGVEFISTMEAYHYPVYALQWHPEMNPYEWANRRALVHSDGAIRAAFHMAAFLVSEATKSAHRFSSQEEEERHLIYGYSPVYTAQLDLFQQAYFFD
ncbi:gamma-glutamyl hydrolase-like [Lampetra fluviatilis]